MRATRQSNTATNGAFLATWESHLVNIEFGISEREEFVVTRHWDPLVVDVATGVGPSEATRARRMSVVEQFGVATIFGTPNAERSISAKRGSTESIDMMGLS